VSLDFLPVPHDAGQSGKRNGYSLVQDFLNREITIREKAIAMMRRIAGIRENSVNPYTDTLASVKRAKQAAGMTL
jgi:hypothetical protein